MALIERVNILVGPALCVLLLGPASLAQAQVTTAITSSGLDTTVTRAGSTVSITGGTRPSNGPNLFHSFGEFSIGVGEMAQFTNTTPAMRTSTILSRVTGGSLSDINGTIDTLSYPTANFFLINPAGVLFGPNAQLNVNGSVNVSTADYLRLNDGVRFNAVPGPTDALLTVAPVAAFGFLGSNPVGTISVQGGTVRDSQTLSLVGRDRAVGPTTTPGVEIQSGTLLNSGGRINLVSVGTPQNPTTGGEVDARTSAPSSALPFSSLGNIQIGSGAGMSTSGNAAGEIFIRAGKLVMGPSSVITAATTNASGGDIRIEAQSMEMGAKSRIASLTQGSGDAGTVSITASTIRIADEATITTTNSSSGGRAGDILLQGGHVAITNGGEVTSSTASAAPGGTVTINASDSVTISGSSDSGGIFGKSSRVTTANLLGTGDAGDVTIVTQNMLADGGAIIAYTTGAGSAGNISLTADDMTVTGGSYIANSPLNPAVLPGSGKTGSITVRAARSLRISGQDQLGISTTVSAGTFGNRDAGGINLSAPTLALSEGAYVETETFSTGRAGDVVIEANRLAITGGGSINSSSAIGNSAGVGGNGGTVRVIATESMDIAGRDDKGLPSGITSGTTTIGRGGNIDVQAPQLTLNDGAVLSSTSSSSGDAGNIRLLATDSFQSRNSRMTTEARQAEGGDIDIQAGRLVYLKDSQMTTLVREGAGSGGNITIDPDFVVLNNSMVLASAAGGNGGNIGIQAGVFFGDRTSVVDASSQKGVSGEVNVQAPIQNLSGALVPLNQGLLRTVLLADRCAAAPDGEFSSFVYAGRDAVPAEPGGFGASPILLDELLLETGGLGHPTWTARRLGLVNIALGCGF